MGEFISRRCPSCQSEGGGAIVQSGVPAERKPLEALVPQWNGFFKEKAFFSYCRCPACHLLFCPTFFSAAQLSGLYAQMPDNTAGVSLIAMARTQRAYYSLLRQYQPEPRGDYLEVGPDIGLFTSHCVRAGRYNKFWLFEPNSAVWPALRSVLPVDDQCYTLSENMSQFDMVPDHSVSTAAMIHVLDHVLDPVSTLKAINKKLSSQGVLMLVTHDESSLLARVMGRAWPPYCLQHPQLFRQSTIQALLNKAGYNVVTVTKSYNYFPLLYLLRHFLWGAGLTRVHVPQWAWPVVRVRLGNIITIARPA